MLSTLAIAGYRSLRELILPLQRLTLVTGPNGSGKSSLYRALRLLAETAQGRLIPTLAREGGLTSTLWAGPESFSRSVLNGQHPVQGTRRKGVIALKLGFTSDEFGYAIDLGLPSPSLSAFQNDPQIKRECVWSGEVLRPATVLVDRRNSLVRARADGKAWIDLARDLATFDSMMTHCADPRNTPELLLLRDGIRGWRFYDQLRTDAASPARTPQVGTHTPVLSSDGNDFAAALQTILEIGDAEAVAETVTDAFPGASVSVTQSADGWFDVEMHQHGLLRPLKSAELSDGTLRYLLWIAALLTPRPPALMVLNEPETSLHPDLLPALARLIVRAADRSQLVVVSHAPALIDALQQQPACHSIMLDKRFGETTIAGSSETASVRWEWPAR